MRSASTSSEMRSWRYENTEDLGGRELAGLLGRYGYTITRQTGAHLRLTSLRGGEHHVTVPAHAELKVGIVSAILGDVASHLGLDKKTLAEDLFGNRRGE